MAPHYPLLFPYGEDGWHPNISLNVVVADVNLDEDHAEEYELQRKHCIVTMAEFYCRAPKFLVDPLEGPSMRQWGSGWNLGHDPDFQH